MINTIDINKDMDNNIVDTLYNKFVYYASKNSNESGFNGNKSAIKGFIENIARIEIGSDEDVGFAFNYTTRRFFCSNGGINSSVEL